MEKFMNFMEEKFVPVAARIGAQRHLVAIRDGFVAIMPLIIAGSLAVLINNMNIPGYAKFMGNVFGDSWTSLGGNVWWGTMAMMSLLVTFTIGYNLARSYDANALTAGVLSLASYLTFIPQMFVKASIPETVDGIAVPAELVGKSLGTWGNISWSFTSYQSLFGAIFVALVVTEVFVRISRSEKLTIKMPDGVPPAVARSFASLIPVIITIFLVGFAQIFISQTGTSLSMFLNKTIQAPAAKVGDTLGGAVTIAFFNHLFWFFGLHGSNILDPIMRSVFMPLATANADLLMQGQAAQHIVTKAFFDAFVFMGGSGTTIGLLAAIFVASKKKSFKTTAGIASAPALFNINEPVVYGLPIVLNPLFVIPFIFGPVLITTISYLATASGLVPMTSVLIPWTTPPILGGFLATNGSLAGAALSAVNLVIAFVIYLPFVKLADKFEKKEQEAEKVS